MTKAKMIHRIVDRTIELMTQKQSHIGELPPSRFPWRVIQLKGGLLFANCEHMPVYIQNGKMESMNVEH